MSRELKALDSVTLVHPRDSEKQQADNQKHTRDNGEIRRPGVYLGVDGCFYEGMDAELSFRFNAAPKWESIKTEHSC